ncbi:hypothetical protein AD939_06995 [Gluconobacter oxydans]|nr:hypothetical protein AD939_06995 [Gluconobacter oxydans]
MRKASHRAGWISVGPLNKRIDFFKKALQVLFSTFDPVLIVFRCRPFAVSGYIDILMSHQITDMQLHSIPEPKASYDGARG